MFKKAKYIFLVCCLSNICTAPLIAQKNSDSSYNFSVVHNKIQGWIDSGYYKGAFIITAKDNKVIDEKYFGNYDTKN